MDQIELSPTQYRVTGQTRPKPKPLENPAWMAWATILPIWVAVIMGCIWTRDLFDMPGPVWAWFAAALVPPLVFAIAVIISDR